MGVAEWVAVVVGVFFPAIGFVVVWVIKSGQKTADRVEELRIEMRLMQAAQASHASSLAGLDVLARNVDRMMSTLARVEKWIEKVEDDQRRDRRIGDHEQED